MDAETIRTISHVLLLIGAIAAAFGGFGKYYSARVISAANSIAESTPMIHVESVSTYKIVSTGKKNVIRQARTGILLDLANTNSSKTYVVLDLVQELESIEIVPGHGLISKIKMFDGRPKLVSTYLLKPNERTLVAFEIPIEYQELTTGRGSEVNLKGKWYLVVGVREKKGTTNIEKRVEIGLSSAMQLGGNVIEADWLEKFQPIDSDLNVKYRHTR